MKTIQLTRGKQTIVDDEDYERLMTHSWAWVPPTESRSGAGYAVRKGNKSLGEPQTVQMHREILNAPSFRQIDHINLNSLDNRKENLRYATVQENGFNRPKPIMPCTSRYKGVFARQNNPETNGWTARIKFNGRHVELGRYRSEEHAAAAYNFASRIFFGRYRRENPGVDELPFQHQWHLFRVAQSYIERYGWYVDTETYRSFYSELLQLYEFYGKRYAG